MKKTVSSVAPGQLYADCKNIAESNHSFRRVARGVVTKSARTYYRLAQRQGACSQPQPISKTPDFSASLQYSPQYLLSSAAAHSHTA